jgi:hypothetical protein
MLLPNFGVPTGALTLKGWHEQERSSTGSTESPASAKALKVLVPDVSAPPSAYHGSVATLALSDWRPGPTTAGSPRFRCLRPLFVRVDELRDTRIVGGLHFQLDAPGRGYDRRW